MMQMIQQPSMSDCYAAVANATLARIGMPQHPRHSAYLQAWMRRHRREVRSAQGGKAAASQSHIALTLRVLSILL